MANRQIFTTVTGVDRAGTDRFVNARNSVGGQFAGGTPWTIHISLTHGTSSHRLKAVARVRRKVKK
jgi:hypothetical protein